MKKMFLLSFCSIMAIATIGCFDKMEVDREDRHRERVNNIRDAVEEELGVSATNPIGYNDIRYNMCEGEEVAVSMMLNESGMSPNLDDYESIRVVDIVGDDGKEYKIIYINDEEAIVPERYK